MKNKVAMMVIKVRVRNWVQPQEPIGDEIHSPYQEQGSPEKNHCGCPGNAFASRPSFTHAEVLLCISRPQAFFLIIKMEP